MVSVAAGGAADRITARIFFKVRRAGSGTPARYSSTFSGVVLPFTLKLFFLRIGRFQSYSSEDGWTAFSTTSALF